MTMHLEGPWLSTTGKKKGKRKFRNADQARKARELADSWDALMKKYEPKKPISQKVEPYRSPKPYVREDDSKNIKSRDTGLGVATKKESPVYTGTLIKGIATMHKSNAVPVFSNQDAVDIAKMRR